MQKLISLEIWNGVTDITIYCDKFEQRNDSEVVANDVRICFDGIIRGIQHER